MWGKDCGGGDGVSGFILVVFCCLFFCLKDVYCFIEYEFIFLLSEGVILEGVFGCGCCVYGVMWCCGNVMLVFVDFW